MNIVDSIYNNIFLKKIFSCGITGEIYIGHLGLNPDADFSANLHVKQQPEIEIHKWGKWGENYDTIVIALLGTQIDDLEITGWKQVSFSQAQCSNVDKRYVLQSAGDGWKVHFTYKTLTFQQCRTYLS